MQTFDIVRNVLKLNSEKSVRAIRFVVGPILLVGGLVTCMYVLESDLMPMVIEAHNAGIEAKITFLMMVKGVAPLAFSLLGLKLIRWESLGVDVED